mgnify:CR=1 FL=1
MDTHKSNVILTGIVRSPFSLDQSNISRLEKVFSNIYGENVRLILKHDPSLIGGIVISIGDKLYDGSIKTQLNNMKEHILDAQRG